MAALVLYSPVEGRVGGTTTHNLRGRQVEVLASCSASMLCQEHGSGTLSQFILSSSHHAVCDSTIHSQHSYTTVLNESSSTHLFFLPDH